MGSVHKEAGELCTLVEFLMEKYISEEEALVILLNSGHQMELRFHDSKKNRVCEIQVPYIGLYVEGNEVVGRFFELVAPFKRTAKIVSYQLLTPIGNLLCQGEVEKADIKEIPDSKEGVILDETSGHKKTSTLQLDWLSFSCPKDQFIEYSLSKGAGVIK